MSNPDRSKLVQALHAHFESLTGNRCTLSYMRIAAWDELIQRGYTAADVAMVIRWIRAQFAKQGSGYSPASLQFSRLIADADIFEDRLNLARGAWRNARSESANEKPQSLPPPTGWPDWLHDNYPTATVPRQFSELPADIQRECREALTPSAPGSRPPAL